MAKTFNINWENKISRNYLEIKMEPHVNFSFKDALKLEIVKISPYDDFDLTCSFLYNNFIQAEYSGNCFLGTTVLDKTYLFKKDCICDKLILTLSKKVNILNIKMIFNEDST